MKSKIISMEKINKNFSKVNVLKNVDFNIYEGQAMALVGENGAGKSTLMKILTGVYKKTSGNIYLNGKLVKFNNTKESQDANIAFIHQELNLVNDLSIAENIFLGRQPTNRFGKIIWQKMYDDSHIYLNKLGLSLNPKTLLKDLSVGQKQLVEIAKALSLKANILIMDEPTGALTPNETEKLFDVIKDLKNDNKSIVYISHRLNEIFEICDDVTILRDGYFIGEYETSKITEDKIVELMVGRKIDDIYPYIKVPLGNETLKIQNISSYVSKNASFNLHKGETLGVGGLMGSGRTELMRSIYGIYPITQGNIYVSGENVTINSPKDALKNGIAYVTEDRKENGIINNMNVLENITLASLKSFEKHLGYIDKKEEIKISNEYRENFSIKSDGNSQKLQYLSGGNQQKVSIAKNLLTKPNILILDEPTRGVDVGARKEIYDIINKLKEDGLSIIIISSDMQEIIGISDRIMVMHENKIQGFLDKENATQEKIMTLSVGKDVVFDE